MINGKIIKVCGMKEEENIREIENLGIDIMGFIFYPKSPRYVNKIPEYLPQKTKRTGVFVNENMEHVLTIKEQFSLDYIQLHGEESPDYCRSLYAEGGKIIKTISISEEADILRTNPYEELCDFFLFDTRCKQYGGSGQSFRWDILKKYHGETPFLLSGGIGLHSLEAIQAINHRKFAGIDINSLFEYSPGQKDVTKVKEFMNSLIKIES